ncbi:MAG TPA: hypothetical protein DCR55_14290 [Lentisphaeria bacterium]|nr:hypothetical protein [Lentisphaeria bacterium]
MYEEFEHALALHQVVLTVIELGSGRTAQRAMGLSQTDTQSCRQGPVGPFSGGPSVDLEKTNKLERAHRQGIRGHCMKKKAGHSFTISRTPVRKNTSAAI